MATILIRNASVFSPDPLGTSDILIINDRIAAIAQNISIPEWLDPVQQMDGKGFLPFPDSLTRMSTLQEEAVRQDSLRKFLPFPFLSSSVRV